MKYLSDYIEAKQTALFNETDTFFAFSKKQFDEQKTEGVQYTALDGGMVCATANVKKLIEGLDEIYKSGIEQDLLENGKDAIIERELVNHEAFYTGEIEATFQALTGYGITIDEVRAIYYKVADKYD